VDPRTPEDILLEQYWRTRGGRLYVEVPIGGPGGLGAWPVGCTTRRLDGVRLLSGSSAPLAVTRYAEGAKAFVTDLQNLAAEIIEVKLSLNRTAIGQAIAGRRMFQRQYGAAPNRTIVLCRIADSALAWVCALENIDVEVCAQARSV
jgi:hypothetical protein